MRMDSRGNKNHALVMVRPKWENGTSIFVFLIAFCVFTFISLNSKAKVIQSTGDVVEEVEKPKAADTGITAVAPVISPYAWELGSEPNAEGTYYWPDLTKWGGKAASWQPLPTTSDLPSGPGFPSTFTMKCTVQLEGLVLKGTCDDGRFNQFVRGIFLGILTVRQWSDTGDKEPILKIGVRVLLQSLSLKGHTYVAQGDELTFKVGGGDPIQKQERDFVFAHLPPPASPSK